MSTSKNFDRIVVLFLVLALVVTVCFINGEALGIQYADRIMGYETRLFDTSRVHTIDIEMDDWDSFISSCEDEEYVTCTAIIDNEAFKNIALRAKGNTSLSNVSSLDSERYSFKIEFDHYDSGTTYHGLDKLSLNNIIQDNTYMKDYLTYRMMAEYGVASPLCSFVYITVNGEDWGLYLAVEGVEDSFLMRNYGRNSGNLYKPDSMQMGGGRGNGKDFNMEDFQDEDGNFDFSSLFENSDFDFSDLASDGSFDFSEIPDDFDSSAVSGDNAMPGNFNPFTGSDGETNGGTNDNTMPMMPGNGNESQDTALPGNGNAGGESSGHSESGNTDDRHSFSFASGTDMKILPDTGDGNTADTDGTEKTERTKPDDTGGKGGNMGGGFSMGSGASLTYTSDDISDYSTIFSSAKTDITEADEERLIASLKSLSEGEDLENVLDIDSLMRYFVVHNYVVNGDSYTGSMVHNYYLYEKEGRLSMIPWDYNLAFGTFQGNNASSSVNDPIDTPLNITGDGSKPIIDWIFESEEYTELYHEYFAEFIDTVDPISIVDEAYELIASYVEKDPTKFCTYEEFEAGVEALRTFLELRTESVQGQLNGTIPSTDSGQNEDSSALVDTGDLSLSDMGTMNNGMGGGKGGNMGGGDVPGNGGGSGDDSMPSGGMGGGNMPDGSDGASMPGNTDGGKQMPGSTEDTEMPENAGSNGMTDNAGGGTRMPGNTDESNMPDGTGGTDRPSGNRTKPDHSNSRVSP